MPGKVERGELRKSAPKASVNNQPSTAEFIKQWEGLRLKAYWDIGGWAICYGDWSYQGEVTTKSDCETRLHKRITQIETYLNAKYPKQEFTPSQKTALISLYYNVSNPAHVEYRIKKGYSQESVANAIKMYDSAGGERLNGLIKRRNAEAQLFLK